MCNFQKKTIAGEIEKGVSYLQILISMGFYEKIVFKLLE